MVDRTAHGGTRGAVSRDPQQRATDAMSGATTQAGVVGSCGAVLSERRKL